MPTLLLIRHGIAERRGEAWPDDRVRPLTRKGEMRMRRIAEALLAIGEKSEVILSSPLTRAMDTARLLAEEWGVAEVAVLDALGPGHAPADTLSAMADATHAERIALVGHEPELGALAAWLIGAGTPLPFRKGGVARIDIESHSRPCDGTLVWFATPKLLLSE